jgi:hypothetical protein
MNQSRYLAELKLQHQQRTVIERLAGETKAVYPVTMILHSTVNALNKAVEDVRTVASVLSFLARHLNAM